MAGAALLCNTMSASEREQAKPVHRKRRMSIMNEVHDRIKKCVNRNGDYYDGR